MGGSTVRNWGQIGKAAKAAGVACLTFGLCSPLFAQERRRPPILVVYGDNSRGYVAEVQRFAGVLDPRDRPVNVAGNAITSFPASVTLVWFGDLSHLPSETADAHAAPNSIVQNFGLAA